MSNLPNDPLRRHPINDECAGIGCGCYDHPAEAIDASRPDEQNLSSDSQTAMSGGRVFVGELLWGLRVGVVMLVGIVAAGTVPLLLGF